MEFVVDKVTLGQVFPPEYFGFTLSISFHNIPLHGKIKKTEQGCTISLKAAVLP
jgi:hypothetical protein